MREGNYKYRKTDKNESKGSRKKVLFLVAGPLREGGRLSGCATKKKKDFFFNVRKKVSMATKPRGGWG